MSIELYPNNNNKFRQIDGIESCSEEDDVEEISGTYSLDEEVLFFKPISLIKSELIESILIKRDSMKFDSSKHTFRERLNVIQWQNKISLLNDTDINAYGTLGLEEDYKAFVCSIEDNSYLSEYNLDFYWKKTSEFKDKRGVLSMLPHQWCKRLMKLYQEFRVIKISPYIYIGIIDIIIIC
ncbi:MAG: hypothetical protein WBG43_11975 [Marinifilaceae bacterium]